MFYVFEYYRCGIAIGFCHLDAVNRVARPVKREPYSCEHLLQVLILGREMSHIHTVIGEYLDIEILCLRQTFTCDTACNHLGYALKSLTALQVDAITALTLANVHFVIRDDEVVIIGRRVVPRKLARAGECHGAL